MDTPSQRLNKFIAHTAGLSRREADEAIAQGRVRVNNAIAALGVQVMPGDIVTLDDKPLTRQQHYTYVMLNKPVGYVCSRRTQGDSTTIYELLPPEYHSLKTVGRLDRDSSGLIILTDDGDFTHRLTHPKFTKTKVYHVKLDHILAPLHQQMISDHGVTLEDGVSKFTIASLDHRPVSETHKPTPSYEVTMHEGRNRQIRRTFTALGYSVVRLHRTQFGPYTLGDLPRGKFTPMTP